MRFAVLSVFTLIGLIGSGVCETGAYAQAPRAQTPAPPYTLDGVVSLIRDTRGSNPVISVRGAINSIKRRGVAFEATAEVIERLRKEKAPEEFIEAVKERAAFYAAIPKEPPPPPKPREGRLTVVCRPVDCAVFLDKKPAGETTKGELKDIVVPEGTVNVSAFAKNYIPDKEAQRVEVGADAALRVDFAFQLDPSALIEKGLALLDGMAAALGGDGALKSSTTFSASGRLEIHDKDGRVTAWPFTSVVRWPDAARFEVSRGTKKFQVVKTDSGFAWKPSPAGAEFDNLEDGLRYLLDHHILREVQTVRGPGVKATAMKLDYASGEEAVVQVEREAYKYRVTLNTDSRPREIVLESGGLNAGLKVMLSDYSKRGDVYFPGTTEVILPGAGMRGVVIRYERVELNHAGVKDEDLKARKGFSSRGR